MSTDSPTPVERRTVALLAAVQFVNVLDFMMVMPLGPDFAQGLGIPVSRLGLIGGSYTAAAAVAGGIGALFLDRVERRRALVLALVGLSLGTVAAAFADGLGTMVAARVLAGAFGGPASAVSLSILADVVPVARRGRAMGSVMAAFSVASVLGVPAGLELARLGSWHTPFFGVGALVLATAALARGVLPEMRGHLDRPAAVVRGLRAFVGDRVVLTALAATTVVMAGNFAIVPNLASFAQFNMGYPREDLGLLYMVGGVVSFAAMKLGGATVDRRGPLGLMVGGGALWIVIGVTAFLMEPPVLPVLGLFVLVMLTNSLRAVALNTLISRVPGPDERARFMSANSMVQHLAAALGATGSTYVLGERPDHRLVGMDRIAIATMAAGVALPLLARRLERLLADQRRRTR